MSHPACRSSSGSIREDSFQDLLLRYTCAAARTATKIPFMCSQKRNCASSVPISTFMCLWAIYIFPGLVYIFSCSRIGRPLTDTWIWNWDWAAQFLFWEYLFRILVLCLYSVLVYLFHEKADFVPELPIFIIGRKRHSQKVLKGTVSRDFLLLVFFMEQFPPSPWVYH
jgi:hypothetical protein